MPLQANCIDGETITPYILGHTGQIVKMAYLDLHLCYFQMFEISNIKNINTFRDKIGMPVYMCLQRLQFNFLEERK